MKNKRNKLREKFKNLVQTRGNVKQQNISESEKDSKKTSEDSEDDAASVDNIKQVCILYISHIHIHNCISKFEIL